VSVLNSFKAIGSAQVKAWREKAKVNSAAEKRWTSAGRQIKFARNHPAVCEDQKETVMELKVVCQCGQKFKFDVEPVNGRMPFAVNCPACNADGTAAANALIAAQLATAPPVVSAPPPPIAPAAGGLRINLPPPPATAATAPPPLAPPPISGLRPAVANKKPKPQVAGEFSLVRGILGALLGAGVGCGLMFGFWLWAHFRFPLMGIAVGAAAGYGARWLARGTETTLGIITAVIAGVSVTGTFVVMYGGFAVFNIISIVICAGVAYRASSE